MKKLRLIALVLALTMVFSGCGGFAQEYDRIAGALTGNAVTRYADMEYVRPDMEELAGTLDAACEAAALSDLDAILEGIYGFYDAYDWFYTRLNLADIRYSGDLTDTYWEAEYGFCMENSASADAMLEELYYALAASPCREELEGEDYFGPGFFDSYEGENQWDAHFVSLLEQEADLQNRYYDLSTEALDYEPGTDAYYDFCADDMAQLLVDLVSLRQEIADYWGYTDYVSFANDFYYYRDYTPQQMADYVEAVRESLAELYRQVNDTDVWDQANAFHTEAQSLKFLRQAAENMGGTPWEAYQLMEDAGLYDTAYGENKYNSSFEVYLTSYGVPFLFVNPGLVRYDCLTLAHEFGHFCNDYASYGSYAGMDVLEVFSQGMEFMALCYGEDAQDLTRIKMADSLCVYVEQAAYAEFEQRMYGLTGDALTVEGLYRLYGEVTESYCFDPEYNDPRSFVEVTHFFTNPMYIFSYIVSNDAALQLYQLEQEQPGQGLKKLEENLDTQESYLLAFLEEAGLESPFAQGRLSRVRQSFLEVFA